jgi:hypothetical protein
MGYRVSAKGVETKCKKIKAICSCPRPASMGDLPSVLGLASYYRYFYGGLSIHIGGLKQPGRCVWGDSMEMFLLGGNIHRTMHWVEEGIILRSRPRKDGPGSGVHSWNGCIRVCHRSCPGPAANVENPPCRAPSGFLFSQTLGGRSLVPNLQQETPPNQQSVGALGLLC